MNLSEATNNESQWAVRHKRFHPIFMPDCDTCQCLLLCRDLIAEVKRLQGFEQYKGLYEAEEIGQRGLREHLESARREKADLERLREAMTKQAMQQEEEIEQLGVALCAMRGALIEVAEDDDPRDGCAHADRAKEALSSAPPACPHKERVDDLEAANCAMRGALESARVALFAWNSMGIQPEAVVEEMNRLYTTSPEIQLIDQALSSTPTCRHKEEVEKLREQLAVGEAGGRLLKAIQEKTEAEAKRHLKELEHSWKELLRRDGQIAALQAALDEANGRVMEAEFKLVHRRSDLTGYRDYCIGCGSQQETHWDERHLWPRERWTEEAKAMRKKG